jgi:N-methylhydantoinase B/oxoprolinase/acetone carboxylase alpha subunit
MPAMISDPIEFELLKNSIFSIADEMALTIFRTTYSGVLKDNMDYSTAMFDGSGKLVAQGLTLPGHLGSMPTAMAAVKEAFAGRIEPGDVFILNDPFQGGMHLPDIFIFKPIFAPTPPSPARGGGIGRGMFGALSQMLPDKVFASSDGGNTGISIGGWDAERRPFIYVDFTCCAWGGRPYADGLDGNSNIYANMASQSIEITETEQPIAITAYEFIPDAMGPGKFRGGAPFRRDYRFLAEEGILQVRSDRRDFRPYGLYGGGPGKPSMNYLSPDRENRPLPSKLTMTIRHGDVFRHEVAGAGGWGDPLERDPAMVLRDVRNELVSLAAARADYGVVLVENPLAVDEAATLALRERQRRARNWPQTPAISWEQPDTAMAAE